MRRGKLIVLEGTDCSGKATQTKKLVERLGSLDIPVSQISFPRYGKPTGDLIGNYYLGKDGRVPEFGPSNGVPAKIASTWYAIDRHCAIPEIMGHLSQGRNVICDRYVESNMGHQGGKIRDAEERLDFFKWLEELEYENFQVPRSNATLFLYVPYQIGMKLNETRAGDADGHERDPDHLRNAEESYLQLADLYRWKKIDCTRDGKMRTVEDIHEEVFSLVLPILGS